MNKRNKLKEDLAWLGLYNQSALMTFKRMYSHYDSERPITEIVDNMPVEKLDWAHQQVKNTIKKYINSNTI
jgi:hypothetical protein